MSNQTEEVKPSRRGEWLQVTSCTGEQVAIRESDITFIEACDATHFNTKIHTKDADYYMVDSDYDSIIRALTEKY